MSQPVKYMEDQLPHYPSLATYPNSRRGHQLRRLKNGVGLCSCERWEVEGFSEKGVIRNHQLHVNNLAAV